MATVRNVGVTCGALKVEDNYILVKIMYLIM
jgi:hypothetical protein